MAYKKSHQPRARELRKNSPPKAKANRLLRDRVRARLYLMSHKLQRADYQRRYRASPEVRARNRALWKQRRLKDIEKHKAKDRARNRRWKIFHPLTYRVLAMRNNARRRSRNVSAKLQCSKDADVLIYMWKSEPTFECCYCHNRFLTALLHVDHFLPIVHGGKHEASNLRRSCASCNLSKGDTIPIELSKCSA